MITSLVGLALGAIGGLEAAKALDRVRDRLRPHGGPAGLLLDKINDKLETRNTAGESTRDIRI